MNLTLRDRRLANEWQLLEEAERVNPPILEISGRETHGEDDVFHVILHQACGIILREGQKVLAQSHAAAIRFPRFFPSVPIEASLSVPVFHPNVDPCNGFVCLWDRFSSGDTVIEAIRVLQRVIGWKSVNIDARHVMQPEAAEWYANPAREWALPLEFTPLARPEFPAMQEIPNPSAWRFRRRLSL